MNVEVKPRKVPKHLQKYVVDQQYEKYTPIDHAVWRYVMRQNHHFLKDTAHDAYVDGLKASGIKIESIPNVDEMNTSLSPYNWGAVNIDGFIPGVIFFDFQGHGFLPIASDIRKLENIQYTPAPDIIHEAAGHAPILLDEKFSEYVKLFGSIGAKALATKEEHELFEAIRTYSNLLESGTGTAEEIQQAKENFEQKQKEITGLSEAEKISRLYWWTVEYGLIGSVENPKIYGAGLLSSVSEGRNSLTPEVTKLPFELESVINTGFDITKPQPQLFVCESFDELINSVKEFASTMAFSIGGTESLEKALISNHTATIVYSSGLQVTGTLTGIVKDQQDEANYIQFTGPTALAYQDKQLDGHGKETHTEGFSSPIGLVKGIATPLEDWTEKELTENGLVIGSEASLHFDGSITVSGVVKNVVREQDKILLISFANCEVTSEGLTQQFDEYDMAVGASIVSVYAGAADSEAFYEDLVVEEQKPLVKRGLTDLEKLYAAVRELRESESEAQQVETELTKIVSQLTLKFPQDWLLRVEILELIERNNLQSELKVQLQKELEQLKTTSKEMNELIERGLKIVQH